MTNAKKKELAETPRKEIVTPEDRAKVVAVQLDTKLIVFTAKPGTAVELTKKYGHLKNLPIDDPKSYDDLVKAIADVRVTRTTTSKEKTVHKAPAIAWNKEADIRANAIVEPLRVLEDTLKDEKERIDAIKADNKRKILEAQLRAKKLQADNLNELRNLWADVEGMSVDDLNRGLADLQAPESLNENDYGDHLEDAQAALRNIRVRLNNAIVQLEKAAKLEQQQKEALKKLDDIAAQEEADRVEHQKAADKLKTDQDAKDKITNDKAIADQKVIDDQNAKILALEEAAKPKPESMANSLNKMSDAEFSSMIDIDGNGKNAGLHRDPEQELSQGQIDSWLTKQSDDVTLETDIAMMTGFVRELEQAATLSPEFTNQEFTKASDRVVDSLVKACTFLLATIDKVKESSK